LRAAADRHGRIDFRAGNDVRCDRSERQWQLVEIRDIARRDQKPPQQQKFLALYAADQRIRPFL
jgi:hypothetical protein